jgi:hypothetical protein
MEMIREETVMVYFGGLKPIKVKKNAEHKNPT